MVMGMWKSGAQGCVNERLPLGPSYRALVFDLQRLRPSGLRARCFSPPLLDSTPSVAL